MGVGTGNNASQTQNLIVRFALLLPLATNSLIIFLSIELINLMHGCTLTLIPWSMGMPGHSQDGWIDVRYHINDEACSEGIVIIVSVKDERGYSTKPNTAPT
jgi:hypothetical protein